MKWLTKFSLVILAILLMAAGCEETSKYEKTSEYELQKNVKEFEYGDCEYIYIDYMGHEVGKGYLAHKGDCKNPIHCHNHIIQASEQKPSKEEVAEKVQTQMDELKAQMDSLNNILQTTTKDTVE